MGTVHRVDGTYNEVTVMIHKAKPETVASVGPCTFFFDRQSARYYTDELGEKVFANHVYKKPKAQEIFEESSLGFKDESDDFPF